jgi:hypothetical protein
MEVIRPRMAGTRLIRLALKDHIIFFNQINQITTMMKSFVVSLKKPREGLFHSLCSLFS